MTKLLEIEHQFRGYHSDGGRCRIEIYTAPDLPALIVATELISNTNTSVTNMAEYLAAEVWERYLTADMTARFDPPFVWVERYERDLPTLRALGRQYDRDPDDWSLVTFKHYRREKTPTFARLPAWRYRIGEPDWRHLTRAGFLDLLAPYLETVAP